ncbi:hypothetical protein BKH41_04510 [Helicobacter sp. 12S02232-10]|uniref:FeoA family protein n=1 Tax=Helicobacter sp. 12S02232-10 TaxID=1476197 RepID=UPI000BA6D0A7|nr:FeoA family protein [Helicobacter sp. 12S02232-10]PAF48895.1 hypothetical protein BKH41_04510 [Helicobacter sp. 12S02232-10]
MTLDQCEKGKSYKIKNINFCDNALKNRFISFGITKNTIITLLHCSTKKSTLAILINQSQIALRDHEAKFIEVEQIA